ncbi:MAG: hypothetical protein OEV00_03760, partial [Acidobacteriota bacterium]|nr:hypothetical protein [Acidobacteriota bacterium]
APYEGSESLSLGSAPGPTWFGAAFTPNVKYDLTAYRFPTSKLSFAMKTTSPVTFMIGMKSGNIDGIGQKWIPFVSGSDPYGFARDGQWHLIEIPLSDIADEVDLSVVSQLFQVLGVEGPISDIEFDDIHFTNGGNGRQPVTLTVDKQGTDAVLSFLSDHETNYRLLHKGSLTDSHWTVHSTLAGDGTQKSVTDPLSAPPQFFLVETIR